MQKRKGTDGLGLISFVIRPQVSQVDMTSVLATIFFAISLDSVLCPYAMMPAVTHGSCSVATPFGHDIIGPLRHQRPTGRVWACRPRRPRHRSSLCQTFEPTRGISASVRSED